MLNMLTKGLYGFSIQLSSFKTNTANAVVLWHTLLCPFILCFCIFVCFWTHNAAWFYGDVLKVKYLFGDSDLSQSSSCALIFFTICEFFILTLFPPFLTYVWMSEQQHSCALCSSVMIFNPFKLSFIMCVSQGMLATLRCVIKCFPHLNPFTLTSAASSKTTMNFF